MTTWKESFLKEKREQDNKRSMFDPLSYNELADVFQQDELDAGLESVKDFAGWQFEIAGYEGCEFKDMRVIRFSEDGKVWRYADPNAEMNSAQIRIKLKVVGFTDEVAEMRSWQEDES
jgi:hypothetical protein